MGMSGSDPLGGLFTINAYNPMSNIRPYPSQKTGESKMSDDVKNQKPRKNSYRKNIRDHMANERTFLAWIRTSIGIMAFGFVVEKFTLFIRQIAVVLGQDHLPMLSYPSPSVQGYSSIFGVFLVALGGLICLLAFIKYKTAEKQIDDNTYHPSILLNIMLTLSVLLIGIFIVIYLNTNF
jgi:uncharacterized membrane protein YidH (DUF202 family)